MFKEVLSGLEFDENLFHFKDHLVSGIKKINIAIK